MKRLIWLLATLAVCWGRPALAATPATPAASPVPARPVVPGTEWAQTISTITGVAISPLVGVAGVGVYRYFHTPAERRARLPWFAQPYFWIPALLLVGIAFAKDTMGPVIPTALKKPFDVAEVFENKISGLVAAGAFVPLMVSVFPSAGGDETFIHSAHGFAAIDWAGVGNLILTPFAVVAFFLVWIASHTINVLILISPFGTVDAALKATRLALLSTLTVTSFVSPVWGAVWSVVLVGLCFFIAGWSFRMTMFGTLCAWDLLTLRRTRFRPAETANWAFTAREIEKTPIRTYGCVSRDEAGRFVMRYRPWLVLAPRTLVLPEGTYAIGRALFHPELLRLEGEGESTMLKFPPRCRTHDQELARIYRLDDVRDVGVRAMWSWLKELFVGKRRAAPQTA